MLAHYCRCCTQPVTFTVQNCVIPAFFFFFFGSSLNKTQVSFCLWTIENRIHLRRWRCWHWNPGFTPRKLRLFFHLASFFKIIFRLSLFFSYSWVLLTLIICLSLSQTKHLAERSSATFINQKSHFWGIFDKKKHTLARDEALFCPESLSGKPLGYERKPTQCSHTNPGIRPGHSSRKMYPFIDAGDFSFCNLWL